MRRYRTPLLVFLLLLGSAILFVGRWQIMPATIAQADGTPALLFQSERLWAPLDAAAHAVDAKLEDHDGQRVLCRGELCLLLNSDVVRTQGSVELVDILWLADALGLGDAKPNRLGAMLNASSAPDNQLAPDFALPDLDGKKLSLSDFRGKKTAVYIWGSW